MSNKTPDDRKLVVWVVLAVLVLTLVINWVEREVSADEPAPEPCYTDTQCGCTLYCLEPAEEADDDDS
jgi:hypothetical protein